MHRESKKFLVFIQTAAVILSLERYNCSLGKRWSNDAVKNPFTLANSRPEQKGSYGIRNYKIRHDEPAEYCKWITHHHFVDYFFCIIANSSAARITVFAADGNQRYGVAVFVEHCSGMRDRLQ